MKKAFKIIGITVLVLIGIGVIANIANPQSTQPQQPAAQQQPAQQAAPAAEPEKPKFDLNAFYAKVAKGMTKAEVEKLAAGAKPDCNESTSEFGKYEMCNYSDASFTEGYKYVGVSYRDDKVDSKSKGGF